MNDLLHLITLPGTYISLLTLTVMEIVLGIDNVVFLALVSAKLPTAQQALARRIGLSLALFFRIGLLLTITWVMGLTEPLLTLLGRQLSGRDLILLGGGFFLLTKATFEIHAKLEGEDSHADAKPPDKAAFAWVVVQIVVLDLVFSLDSVVTAVGMAQHLPVMIAAVIISVALMLLFAGAIGEFIERHPSMKMLALSFLMLIGTVLIADAVGHPIAKTPIYFAMAFSFAIELLNIRIRHKGKQAP